MPLLHILILALIQGITEFLPISSSGHLILAHQIIDPAVTLAARQQQLLIDVAVHVGTLFSVLIYFRSDIANLCRGLIAASKGQTKDQNAKLNFYIILSSVPVILAGFAIHHFEIFTLRSMEVVAWTTLIFGIFLWVVDARKSESRTLPDMNWQRALLIGCAQMLALIPGVSRSGITMTAARALGFTRTESARYSLLLAIIAISGAGLLGSLSVIKMGDASFGFDIFLAAILSFISGLVAITLMMKWLKRASFKPFAIYRIIIGLILLGMIYTPFLSNIF